MHIVRYCFIGSCHCGVLKFYNDSAEMVWKDDSNLSELARKFKKYIPLKSKREIELFISERCINEYRPDRGIWLGLIGLSANASDLAIFLSTHGTSINDLFWINDTLDLSFWNDNYREFYPDL